MSNKEKISDNANSLNLTNCHVEEDFSTIFGIREAGQQNLYNDTIEKLNLILDSVKERYNFLQYGAKTGELYYTHAVKGIHHILQLQDFIFSPPPQEDESSLKKIKLLCLSYLIHDLNKFEWNKEKRRSELWSVVTIQAELEAINSISNDKVITNFFPEWMDYINDIYTLILGHSRIHRYSGRLVFSDIKSVFGIDTTSLNTKLSKKELSKGIDVMQLVDILDLIKELSFQTVKVDQVDKDGKPNIGTINQGEIFEQCKIRLSNLLDEAVVFEKVTVTMNASKFSNIILNCVIEVLGKEYSIYPLLTFTSGVIFFAKRIDIEKATQDKVIEEIQQKIADRLVQLIDELVMSKINEKSFLYSVTGQGVKIGKYIYQQPDEKKKMKDMLEYLSTNLEPFAYKVDEEDRKSPRYTTIIKSNDYMSKTIKSHPFVQKWENGENWDFIGNDILWRMARFCHTAFITVLKLYQRKNEKVDQAGLMRDFLERLEIFNELSEIYDQSDDISQWYRFAFFHLVGEALFLKKKTMENITPILIEYILEKMDDLTIEEKAIPNPLEFVKNYVHLFGHKTTSSLLVQQSEPNNDILCTVCGKRLKSLGSIKKDYAKYKWFAEHVPDGITVQKFSNFKMAGEKREPVRMICGSCKWRFYLEKIMALVSGKFATIYSTFYFPDGYPYAIVRGIQRTLESFKDDPEYGGAFMIDLLIFKKNHIVSLKPQKAYGFAFPAIKQEICGSIPLSWKIDQKLTVNEQFWNFLKQVIIISTQTRLKVVVSKLKNDYEELLTKNDVLIHDIPSDYKWIFGNIDILSFETAQKTLDLIIKIEDIVSSITNKDVTKHCVETIKKLQSGVKKATHYLDALIRSPSSRAKKAKNQNYKIMVMRGDALSKLKELYDIKSTLMK